MRKILIATKNQGKMAEIAYELGNLAFEYVSLNDIGLQNVEMEENCATTWENARKKAEFYAKKSGLMTIAEDTGLFVDALAGWPGVGVKRSAPTPKERVDNLLNKLSEVKKNKRTAYFETSACVYDPKTENFYVSKGAVKGLIKKEKDSKSAAGVEFDSVFYYPPLKKTFSRMTANEKSSVSHRGKALRQLKLFLLRQYSFKQLVVPGALVVNKNKLLLTKRRDDRPAYNNKWEFPGGGVDNGESIENCLYRECLEETGLKVKILERLPVIPTFTHHGGTDAYQVFLIVFICKIVSGKLKFLDSEVSTAGWFTLREALKLNFLPKNKQILKSNLSILKKYVRY